MRADSWRVGIQGSFWGALALCAVLGAGGCTKSTFGKVGVDGGSGTLDGGKNDARASDGSGTADAQQTNVCSPGTVSKSKGKAESCSCDDECQTGFCVDGLCCTSACGQPCMACNLPSSLGECAMVPPGVKPNDPLVCAASTPATCGQDGTCDGQGGCRLYVNGTECKAGTCDGDSVTGILSCDGNGKCSETSTLPCPPYTCDPATNRCALTCTTNALCAPGYQCVAGSCGTKANGQPCPMGAVQCTSGFCADGVCCDVACSVPCESCNQTGSLGLCSYIPAGQSDPACNASDATTCGYTGQCDGLGSCTLYPEDSPCGSSSCSGTVENTPPTCDGQGNCRDSQLVDCSPFLCTNGTCTQICKTDADCDVGHQCVLQTVNGVTTGTCGQGGPGYPCTDAAQCQSSQCVDGVCCESACAGPCRSCSLASSPGQCSNVATGAPDPRNTCKDLGAASCSTNGVCDGNGACQAYPVGTVCAPQTCVAGLHTPASTCNASGQCVPPPSIPCNPYVCNGATCYGSCTTSNIQCASGNVCTGASCGLKPNGANCGAGTECQSGFCAQGVCCNSACTAPCMACNLSATNGICTAVADNAPDPQGKCVATQSNTCGTTGNCVKGACSYWTGNCKSSICANISSVTPVSTCDGKGACVTPTNQSCGGFACDAGACKTTCTVATQAQDCVSPSTCVTISGVLSCGLKVNGAACTASSQCQSGFCTEGVCCNNACSSATSGGLCETCKATGTNPAGTCHNVPAGGSDPNSLCVKKTDCSDDGTCDGNGACHPQSTGTVCGLVSCTGSTLTSAPTCDGAGKCQPGTGSSCGDYVCNSAGTACLDGCTEDTDCTNGLTCVLGLCGTKLGAGKGCKQNSDCTTGLVCSSEGVCCDQSCAGGCQSCITPNLGKCTSIKVNNPPRTSGTCPSATGSCGNTGNCDGAGNCQQITTCNDGNACTQTDTCQAGVCTGSNPVVCSASDQCHTAGVCNTTTGACSNPNAANGTACNDGNSCTQTDTCQAGVCTGSNPVVCTASDQCHVAGTCNTSTGLCSNPNASNGTSCNDGNSCTQTDTCQTGVCTGSNPVVCTASDQCHVAGTCNTSTGLCSNPNASNGTSCNDGNACTQTDTCQSGVCTGSNPVTCPPASDQCHVAGTCDPSTGACSNPAAGDGTICNDGNACTQTDTCQSGVCAGSNPVTCTASDQCHGVGTCDPGTGICSNPPQPNGTSCSDGDPCCVSGFCNNCGP